MPEDGVAIASGSAPPSPKSRLKFLCSHGGKILPRPFDGHLKYVGGETRVISVPRDISFQELMKRLNYPTEGEMTLKYQVLSEDLDALVTVRSDEDNRHMLDEIERYETSGAPRLRAFLFPTNPIVTMDNSIISSMDPRSLEQRYIEAVNGIFRPAPNPIRLNPTIMNTMHQGSMVSSACTSPQSPDSCTTEAMNSNEQNSYYHNNNMGRTKMHRVRSLPSICSHSGFPQQQQSQYSQQISNQYVQHPVFQSSRLHVDPQKSVGPERHMPVRYQMDPPPPHSYGGAGVSSRQWRGNGGLHYEECGGHVVDRRVTERGSDRRVTERGGNLATSPVLWSPLGQMRGDV